MTRRRWWALALGVLLLGFGSYFGIQRYRYRLVHADRDLLDLLPHNQATVFFADVSALRRAHFLDLLAGSQLAGDPQYSPEYAQFIRQTGFDYTRDLAALAGSSVGGTTWLAARGRFDWSRLTGYAAQHGGVCRADSCRISTGAPDRSLSFCRLQPDVLAFAIGASPNALTEVKPHPGAAFALPSDAPVWLQPAHSVLSDPAALPLPARIFAISLQSADSLVLTLDPSSGGSNAVFNLDLYATFTNGPTADTARQQLQSSTRLLKAGMAGKGHAVPDPGTLEWLLTSGTFQVNANQLSARWPVRRELLDALR